jgi:hypothetical protein
MHEALLDLAGTAVNTSAAKLPLSYSLPFTPHPACGNPSKRKGNKAPHDLPKDVTDIHHNATPASMGSQPLEKQAEHKMTLVDRQTKGNLSNGTYGVHHDASMDKNSKSTKGRGLKKSHFRTHVLKVDTEGLDFEVVYSFLHDLYASCRQPPAIVQLEVKLVKASERDMLSLLLSLMGYDHTVTPSKKVGRLVIKQSLITALQDFI